MSLTRSAGRKASRVHSNRRPRSIGLIFFNLIIVLLASTAKVSAAEVEGSEGTSVDDKYSLKADLKEFEELRKNIPSEKRKENDEKAFMDQMMTDLSKSPAEVRNRFSSIVNKKRDLFNKDMIKARQKFGGQEKNEREKFNKEQTEIRKDFQKKKATSEERKEFFDDYGMKRKEFYLDQKEKRDEFESDIREKRKDFDDYIRAKTDEFNQLHRDYTKRYEENKKSLADLKKQAEEKKRQFQRDLDQEYDPIRKKSPTTLQPYTAE